MISLCVSAVTRVRSGVFENGHKSKRACAMYRSAEGAEYDSQGQARATRARRPWLSTPKTGQGLKGRNSITPFQGWTRFFNFVYQGRRASRLPWLSYSAPLALSIHASAGNFRSHVRKNSRRQKTKTERRLVLRVFPQGTDVALKHRERTCSREER